MRFAIAVVELPDPPAECVKMARGEALDALLEARTLIEKRIQAVAKSDPRCVFDVDLATLKAI